MSSTECMKQNIFGKNYRLPSKKRTKKIASNNNVVLRRRNNLLIITWNESN